MFILFGTAPKTKIEANGKFNCPKCIAKTNYLVKSNRSYFTLFFIPIFPIGEKNEPYVECQLCQRTYYTDVLENNNFYEDGRPFYPEKKQNHYEKNIKQCPNCKKKLRLPENNHGTVKCPNCTRKFYTVT